MAASAEDMLSEASRTFELSGPLAAMEAAERAIAAHPAHAQLRNFRAVVLCALRRQEEAYAELLAARALDPTIPVIHLNLDAVATMLGHEDDGSHFQDYIATLPKACPYFPSIKRGKYEAERLSRIPYHDFDAWLERGFRRTGSTLSRYVCPDCVACRQVRIVLRDADLAKWKRLHRLNADCVTRLADTSCPGPDHVDLLGRYLKARHGWKGPGFSNEAQELHFGFENSRVIETRLDGRLIAVAVVDEGISSLYAAASYYDPDLSWRSLGTLNVLSMIAHGKARSRDYLYLGEAIDSLPNMAYKKRFKPWEWLDRDGQWKPMRLLAPTGRPD